MGLTRRPNRPWADWEREELRRMVARPTMTFAKIAHRFNRTEAAIANQMTNMGLRLANTNRAKDDPIANILFNGEPLIFAETGPTCARCGVREDVHHQHGCGRFAGELRVRER